MVRALTFLLLLTATASAQPARYVVQCNATCTASDGTMQPAGTALNRIIADPASFTPPTNTALVADTGQALYAPPPPTPTTIDALSFIRRFTPAEQSVLQQANPLWGLQIAAAGTINVDDPTLIADMQTAVTAGLLTQARMNQVLNLGTASP